MRAISQIESIRVLAMVGIFFYHLWSVVPGMDQSGVLGQWIAALCSRGYLGVIIFNIITGFVLTLSHTGANPRPLPAYPQYLSKRLWRILPHYYLALAVGIVANLFWDHSWGRGLFISITEHVFLVHTLDPACFFSLIPALWWMGLLVQFYLFFPVLLRLVRALGPEKFFIACCAVCFGFWYWLECRGAAEPDSLWALAAYQIYYNLPARLPEFALGIALAFIFARKQEGAGDAVVQLTAARLTLLGFCASLAVFFGTLQGGAVLTHIKWLVICSFFGFALFSWPKMAELGTKKLVIWGGGVSFSFYLVHQPLLSLGVVLFGQSLAPMQLFWTLALGVGLSTCLVSQLMDLCVARFLKSQGVR